MCKGLSNAGCFGLALLRAAAIANRTGLQQFGDAAGAVARVLRKRLRCNRETFRGGIMEATSCRHTALTVSHHAHGCMHVKMHIMLQAMLRASAAQRAVCWQQHGRAARRVRQLRMIDVDLL